MNIAFTNQPPMATIPMEEYDFYQNNFWKIKAYDNMIKGLDHFKIKISFEVDRAGNYIGYSFKTQSDDFGISWEG